MDRAEALSYTILHTVVGSHLHGTNVDTSDHDEMGILIEPPEYVIGLDRFEQYTQRSQPEGHRSGPGDVDLTLYSLRKWAGLALKGNPSVLVLLFAPESGMLKLTDAGRRLQRIRYAFLSVQIATPFLGYLEAQRQRLLGVRGQMRVTRTDLIDKHGYDTKYASHMIRLGMQGVELLRFGKLTLPMREEERQDILRIRQGLVSLDGVLAAARLLEDSIRTAALVSDLPRQPARGVVTNFLIDEYRNAWQSREL